MAGRLASNGYRVLEKGPAMLGALKAYQRRQVFVVPQANVEVIQLQIHAIRGNEAIVVTATDEAGAFEKNLPAFNAALAQFRFSSAV